MLAARFHFDPWTENVLFTLIVIAAILALVDAIIRRFRR